MSARKQLSGPVPWHEQRTTAALEYAEGGLAVFRLGLRSKKPLKDSHGFEDATTDSEVIREWFREQPFVNVGMRCGRESSAW